jgi:hypothetical protein
MNRIWTTFLTLVLLRISYVSCENCGCASLATPLTSKARTENLRMRVVGSTSSTGLQLAVRQYNFHKSLVDCEAVQLPQVAGWL